jgi:hypothetical protein
VGGHAVGTGFSGRAAAPSNGAFRLALWIAGPSVAAPITLTFNRDLSQCAQMATPIDGYHIVYTLDGARFSGGQSTMVRILLSDAAAAAVGGSFSAPIVC